jgi:hypothetical protein
MSLKSKGFVLLAMLCLVPRSHNLAKAQAVAEVPPAIHSATKLFVSNADADRDYFQSPSAAFPIELMPNSLLP